MTAMCKKVLADALTLGADERASLAGQLLSSIGGPGEECSEEETEASWEIEIDRRIKEIDSGTAKLIPAEEVMAGLRRRPR